MSPMSPVLQGDSLPIEPLGKPQSSNYNDYKIKYADNEEKEKILAEK